ncbi:hypothetical protein NLG97_g8139 [Lecanicillium saksenae]|uniref:Uncharacterized protein n=1 Tax=Lecanicillium saksenae TaxID=468837 RepID=A0ACC1QKY5_9HYPO|nr:hypothetical protein NLG97_g8139 [Lecanicillium saksenae]
MKLFDLEDEIDEQLAELKVQMERACLADNEARRDNQPALHKLKLLPQVNAILNRNNVQHAVLDPETNFLLHVKYFLEPLSDGSLPAYNIQRDLFTALTKLNIEKESLRSSGIGKIVLFYTKSKKPEPSIKRMAERLLGEWSRPILKRTDDYKKRHVETREFDYHAAKLQQRQKAGTQFSLTQRPAQSAAEVERERMLAPTRANNEARMASLPSSYTIAPMSTFDGNRANDHRPLGASGMEAFRKMTQKSKKRAVGGLVGGDVKGGASGVVWAGTKGKVGHVAPPRSTRPGQARPVDGEPLKDARNAETAETPKAAEVDPQVEREKKARNLKKKLKQAKDLKVKKDEGQGLLPEQIAKVIKINELIRELSALGFDEDGEKKEAEAASDKAA